MRILLIGDYSGVHSELRAALLSQGHEVQLVSDGDGYKGFSRDMDFSGAATNSRYLNTIFEYLGIKGLGLYFFKRRLVRKLEGFDVVQIINPIALECFGSLANYFFIKNLVSRNKKLFMCALGDDQEWVRSCLSGAYKYSPLDKYNIFNIRYYLYSMRYKYGLFFGLLHRFCMKNASAIIPGLLDYKIAYRGIEKCTEIVPLPISSARFSLPRQTGHPIKIFHGWQQGKERRKGNDIFDEAVGRILLKYGDLVNYNKVSNVTFQEYLKLYSDADIFLDQCYSYDRGVNGVLGMASGKVVFSGFEDGSCLLSESPCIGINAGNTVDALYSQLEELLTNLDTIDKIKNSAYEYSTKLHDSHAVAEKYLKVWSGNG